MKIKQIAEKLIEAGFRLEPDGNIIARGAGNFQPALEAARTLGIPRGSSALNGYAVWLHQPLPEGVKEALKEAGAVKEVAG